MAVSSAARIDCDVKIRTAQCNPGDKAVVTVRRSEDSGRRSRLRRWQVNSLCRSLRRLIRGWAGFDIPILFLDGNIELRIERDDGGETIDIPTARPELAVDLVAYFEDGLSHYNALSAEESAKLSPFFKSLVSALKISNDEMFSDGAPAVGEDGQPITLKTVLEKVQEVNCEAEQGNADVWRLGTTFLHKRPAYHFVKGYGENAVNFACDGVGMSADEACALFRKTTGYKGYLDTSAFK